MPDLPLPKPSAPNKQTTVTVDPAGASNDSTKATGGYTPTSYSKGDSSPAMDALAQSSAASKPMTVKTVDASVAPPTTPVAPSTSPAAPPTTPATPNVANASGSRIPPLSTSPQSENTKQPAVVAQSTTPTQPAPASAPPTASQMPQNTQSGQSVPKPPTTITALNSMSAPAQPLPAESPKVAATPQEDEDKKFAAASEVATPTNQQIPTATTASAQHMAPVPPGASVPPSPVVPPTTANIPPTAPIVAPPSRPPGIPHLPTTVQPGLSPTLAAQPSGPGSLGASPAGQGNTPVAPAAVAASPTNTSPKDSATFAKPKRSLMKLLPILVGAFVLIGVIAFAIYQFFNGSSTNQTNDATTGGGNRVTVPGTQTTVTYWGLWEPSEVLTEVIEDFETENPGIAVEYVKQSHRDYRERLQTAIASGAGPDVFRFHASWVPMLSSELSPLPDSVLSADELESDFYPAASKMLVAGGQVVGVPLMYDGLALLYNTEMLTAANAQPPTTWSEVRELANTLTIRSDNTIERAGIAMGTSNNVEHFSDIVAVLMLQNGATFTSPNSPETRDALLFYTNFARADRVWDASLPSSSVAFARGEVAMIFAPSWRIHEIQAQNPNLKFGVAPLPTLTDERLTWASFWAEGVNAKSANKEAAQKFVAKLAEADVLKKLYSSQSQVRAFGEMYPRQSLAPELLDSEYVSPYLEDAPYAEGWYMSSSTHDNGINDQIIKYYADAINSLNDNKKAEDVLSVVDQGVKQVLRQYGVTTTKR